MLKHPRLLGILATSGFLFVGASVLARAQTPLATATGDVGHEYFGHAVSAAGDVDADGVPDFVVGSDTHTTASKGRVWIYSGATHQVLHTMVGTQATDYLGASVAAAGDFNLDGHDDALVGAPKGGGSGVAQVLSGLDGSVLHTFSGAAFDDNLGEAVANAGDVNGDGRPDLIISAPYCDVDGVENVGAAVVYSGANGSILLTFVGATYNGYFGSVVDGVRDLDGDGYDDLAIGERGAGSLRIFSGFNGSLIRVHAGGVGFSAGRNVAGLGDVDHDGVPDYAAGSPNSGPPATPNSGFARVYSGLDGSLLHEFVGHTGHVFFGCAIDAAGDVDGDAVPDILIGARGSSLAPGRAEIYSGSDWSLLQTFSNDVEQDAFGRSVAGVGDTNGDGVPDVLIGFDGSSQTTYRTGAVRLDSGLDSAPWFSYCEALPNSSYDWGAAISYVGSPSVSEADVDLIVTYAVKGMVGLCLYGPAQQQTLFGNGNLCVGGGGVGVFRLEPFVMLDHPGFGSASLDFSQPPLGGGPGMITPGSTWNFQAWFRDTPAGGAGFNLTNALSATFQP